MMDKKLVLSSSNMDVTSSIHQEISTMVPSQTLASTEEAKPSFQTSVLDLPQNPNLQQLQLSHPSMYSYPSMYSTPQFVPQGYGMPLMPFPPMHMPDFYHSTPMHLDHWMSREQNQQMANYNYQQMVPSPTANPIGLFPYHPLPHGIPVSQQHDSQIKSSPSYPKPSKPRVGRPPKGRMTELPPSCSKEQCSRRACCGISGQKPIYCKSHAFDGMVQLCKTLCENPQCPRQPKYAALGEKPRFCREHAEGSMVHAISKKCSFEGCIKSPSYAMQGDRPKYCLTHKSRGMVNVKKKLCLYEGCKKQPSYGYRSGGGPQYCHGHSKPGMVTLMNKLCESPGCLKHPTYGMEKGKPRFCKTHSMAGMIDVKRKVCQFVDCRKAPTYGLPGQKPSHCSLHALQDMVDSQNKQSGSTGLLAVSQHSGHQEHKAEVGKAEGKDTNMLQQLSTEEAFINADKRKLEMKEATVKIIPPIPSFPIQKHVSNEHNNEPVLIKELESIPPNQTQILTAEPSLPISVPSSTQNNSTLGEDPPPTIDKPDVGTPDYSDSRYGWMQPSYPKFDGL